MLRFAVLMSLVTVIVCGCTKGEVQVTDKEEQAFRNPPKQMPAEAAEGMRKGMEKAAQSQQQNK